MAVQSSQEFIGRSLQRAYKQIHARLVHELHDMGYTDITQAQAEILSYITDDGSSIVELAKTLGVTKQAAGELVKQLKSFGYVSKRVSTSDARSYTVMLDSRGRQLIRDAVQLKEAIETEYSQILGKRDFEAFIASLRRLNS